MKKYLMIIMVAVLGMTMTSCLTKTKATVDVQVVDILGVPQDGQVVCMFTNDDWDEYTRVPADASKRVVTDANGVASFNIQGIYFDVLDKTATLYFAIFDGDDKCVDYKAITVRQGGKESLKLTKK